MRWITAQQLVAWSKRLDAAARLPDLIADLIRATVPDWNRLRFPGGDLAQVRGWDGALEAVGSAKYIPSGRSKWEFGKGGGAAKATKDYNARTKKVPAAERAQTVLTLVNLEAWNTPRETLHAWEQKKTAEGQWLAVRYLDAIEIAHWLDECPAVAARYAREVLGTTPSVGALSTDEYWEGFSKQFHRPLNEKVVIGDRTEAAAALVEKLLGSPQAIPFGVEIEFEAVAFVVAAIRTADPAIRHAIELRTLVVESEQAAQQLTGYPGHIYIAVRDAAPKAGQLSTVAPTVYAVTGVSAKRHNLLKRSSATAMADGFAEMGLTREDGYEIAHRCGRSLAILLRQFAHRNLPPPSWVGSVDDLKPALLAGGWASDQKLDKEALCELSGGLDYHALEGKLKPFTTHEEPPLDRAGSQWQVRAPVDAFQHYGHRLSERDFQTFRTVALRVLSHVAAEPSPDTKFSLTYTAPEDYSRWLREGIATTLVIIASMHQVAAVVMDEGDPQRYVDSIISALPDFGRSAHALLAMGPQMALLAEASPSPFILALESMLEGHTEELASLFKEAAGDMFAPTSPHVYLLCALETLAWDPDLLVRASLVLAGLAQIASDGRPRGGKRPIDSLREILIGWSPSTYATCDERMACIDAVMSRYPFVAWHLVISLLPTPHDTSVSTRKPRFRDPRPLNEETLTFGIVWRSQSELLDRALGMAQDSPERMAELAGFVRFLRPNDREVLLDAAEQELERQELGRDNLIWRALSDEFDKTRLSARDDPGSDSQNERLERLVSRFRPNGVGLDRALFDDWLPVARLADPGNYAGLIAQRALVLREIVASDGVAGIVGLAQSAKVPESISPVLADIGLSLIDAQQLVELSLKSGNPGGIAGVASVAALQADEAGWKEKLAGYAKAKAFDASTLAELCLAWPTTVKTWDFVKSLGAAVNDHYWRVVRFLPTDDPEAFLVGAAALMDTGRPLTILAQAHQNLDLLPTRMLVNVLRSGVHATASDPVMGGGAMLSYYAKSSIADLASRADIASEEIVGLEYMYFPFLEDAREDLLIDKQLAKDPNFYVELLSHVFRAEGDPPRTLDATEEMWAKNSFRVLHGFTSIPGWDGTRVDRAELASWVESVQQLSEVAGRRKIADHNIGKLMAHCPDEPEGELWPTEPVCQTIENLATPALLDGFVAECFNKRGVYSKGPFDGGGQERALAERYATYAKRAAKFPKVRTVLQRVSQSWLSHAEHEDIRAEQNKMEH